MNEIVRNLLRRKLRSSLTISGIVIGIVALTTMGALANNFNALLNGGVKYYALGNEPGLWNSTHRDIHPAGDTLPELRDRIISYASMVKALDPGAERGFAITLGTPYEHARWFRGRETTTRAR